MLRIKLLRNLLLLSLTITIFLPGHEYFVLRPSYEKLLIEATESEAVRYASYMVRTFGLENQSLVKDRLPEALEMRLKPVSRDKQLVKLRIFSAQGEVIFSTSPEEVGNLNDRSYFREVVARGIVYSKVVHKDQETAEGVVAQVDIVETYVPFMVDSIFGGAIEVYYDITAGMKKAESLFLHSLLSTIALSLGFFLAICFSLYRTYVSFQERDAADEALRVVNEELEMRVAERTMELSDANEQLTAQFAERTQAQIALKQALEESKVDRERLDVILQSVPDGVVVANGELNVLHLNSAAEEILGTSLERVLGQSVAKLNQNVDFVKKVGQRLNVAHASRSFDFELSCGDAQKTRIYQVRISQFVSDQTESPGVILLIRDVTREREVEQMKSAFLGMAAHELNTPLTTIIGYSELLTTEETAVTFSAAQQKEFLQLIHGKALALGGLIDDLLDISRVESGRSLPLDYQLFAFGELVHKVVSRSREEHHNHVFEVELPESAPLYADQARLEQVVGQLIGNAVKYSPDGGRVMVALSSSDDHYELIVEDEGIGMDDEQLSHIFDRFYRADSSDTAVQGVGLGMSLVRNIVLAHHGAINVDSQPGRGTLVRVVLPATLPIDNDEAPQPFS